MMNMGLSDHFFKNLILFSFFTGLYACGTPPEYKQPFVLSGFTMGTTYTIKMHGANTNIDHDTISKGINSRLDKINSQMSTYIKTSALSIFNQSRTQDWQEIPAGLYTVIKEALRINKLSHHAFDITVGSVVNLWGFGPKTQSNIIPNQATIEKALDKVGSQYIHLRTQPYAMKKDKPNLYIDLSAIAKGYAVDMIAAYLDELSINNYMVEIGGEIKTKGNNPNNKIWHIGIENPLDGKSTAQIVIALDNAGMATSGDYRNYFEVNDVRYSHTIDPMTGKPITHKLASVTVLHPSTMAADAIATALLILGSARGFELALKKNLAALFIVRNKDDFIEIMTPAFKRAIIKPKSWKK